MADKPGSSRSHHLQNIKEDFLNSAKNIESARFLKRIIQKTDQQQYGKIGKADFLERAHFFTGLDKRVFPIFSPNVQIKDLEDIKRSTVHERYVSFYLNASRWTPKPDGAPTTKNLFAALFGKIPYYVDIRTFRKYLVKMGYGWLRIAKGYIVIEKPNVTFERYYYLKDITRFREEKRDIFYVDETVLTGACNYYDLQKYNTLMKAADHAGLEIVQKDLIKSIYAVSKTGVIAFRIIGDFTANTFEKWIINDLLPALPPKSVVVIKDIAHHDDRIKKPTLYSIKADMIEWLRLNNVPYDENMSKCDLMSLIDIYTTEADEICKIENMLKVNGHGLLRLPFSIAETTPATFLFDLIKLNAPILKLKCEEGLRKLINGISQETFEEYDKNVADFEKETSSVDLMMDEIFDSVVRDMQNVRLNELEDSEVPLSDSD